MFTEPMLPLILGEKVKKVKVLLLLPDYYGRDSNSMDMNIHKIFLTLSLTFFGSNF